MSVVSTVANSVSSGLAQLGLGTSTTANSSSTSSNTSAGTAASQQLAGNFDTFLQLLTTQLQNQDPLSPLDTDQFTQQLVEFASVEQQYNMNTNLQTLVSLQQTSEATAALQLVGSSVTVGGSAATLSNATNTPAAWALTASGPGTANITITNSSGQTVYTGTTSISAGAQTYTWSGQGNNGVTWPDGTYTLAVNATGANGSAVTVSTQVQGTVSGVNLSQTPPTLIVNGQNVAISQVTAITGGNSGALGSLNNNINTLNTSINSLAQYL